MSRILLLANLNCDRVLQLNEPLVTGGRHHYQDSGRRLGGGGANTGLGLVYAGQHVALVSQIGNDKTADWLLAEASLNGLDCHLLQRNEHDTPELLLLMTPDGERTIIRPRRPIFELGNAPDFKQWDALYINSSAQGTESWAESALIDTLVIAQLAKDERKRPCHILISSRSDIAQRSASFATLWDYGAHIAGPQLRFFVITDGANGATAYSQDTSAKVPAIITHVVDTTGAGDAFAAGLIDGLLQQQTITQAMQQASHWASIAVASDSSIPAKKLKHFINQPK